jgi:iron complex outermembrane receptor protein
MHKPAALVLSVLIATLLAGPVFAQPQPAQGLGDVSLEDLMNIRVTSAARKSQRVEDVAAAVYVITRDDIIRSGLTRLPEILRLAPGVQVSQINASKWAVSIRGFNSQYSNKLLVLIDGRSVYNLTFSGVFWDLQDVMVSDIDRIEVIRGPGGAVWGANAVNGVINIITRPASETQGFAVDASVGTFERERIGLRYGGTLGPAAYRLFGEWTRFDDAEPSPTTPFEDHWHSLTSGFRTDWARGGDSFLAQAHVTANRTRAGWREWRSFALGTEPITDGISRARHASLQGRWTRTRPNGTIIQVQGYHTATRRDEPVTDLSERSTDFDTQYEMRAGTRHGLVFGGGYRWVALSADDTLTLQIGEHSTRTANVFVQDEIVVTQDVALTLGAKLEHDTFGGWGLLPSARVMWEASTRQRVWAAAARARRTPSVLDRALGVRLAVVPGPTLPGVGPTLPVVIGLQGSPDYETETFLQAEAGYRVRVGADAGLEFTAYRGTYEALPTAEPLLPVLELTPAPPHLLTLSQFANFMDMDATGFEVNARWTPVEPWQFDASYTYLHLDPKVDPASRDTGFANLDGSAPRHQWHLRSTVAPHTGVQLSASLWRVGRLEDLAVPAYTRLDARAELRLNTHATLAATGQNLSQSRHQEFAIPRLSLGNYVGRTARIDLRWAF